MTYQNPNLLIQTQELNSLLDTNTVKIFDTAVYLHPQPGGTYQVESGRSKYEDAHIPGAGFIDLVDHWADTTSPLRFTLPTPGALAQAIGEAGISPNDHVVLYSNGHLMWATRAFWLLRHAGHKKLSILNGNFTAWQQAGLPVAQGEVQFESVDYPVQSTNAFANTDEVEQGMHGKVCTINALTQSLYEGTGEFYYQRRGHIPGSKLLYYDAILDNEHFLPAPQLEQALSSLGMLEAPQVITYCGGGIAATLDAFACVLCGQEQIQVYDGSMSEWVIDEERPLTEGAQP